MTKIVTKELQDRFIYHLRLEEKSLATVTKYAHDISVFAEYMMGKEVIREQVLAYKNMLIERYAVSSANSMIAALNVFSFLRMA